jgi:hypothetical protein
MATDSANYTLNGTFMKVEGQIIAKGAGLL